MSKKKEENAALSCFRKLRIGTATTRGRRPVIFGVPLPLLDFLGWAGGETVYVIADRQENTLTLKVVNDGEN